MTSAGGVEAIATRQLHDRRRTTWSGAVTERERGSISILYTYIYLGSRIKEFVCMAAFMSPPPKSRKVRWPAMISIYSIWNLCERKWVEYAAPLFKVSVYHRESAPPSVNCCLRNERLFFVRIVSCHHMSDPFEVMSTRQFPFPVSSPGLTRTHYFPSKRIRPIDTHILVWNDDTARVPVQWQSFSPSAVNPPSAQ